MESDVLIVEKKGNLCKLIINLPEKRNSLTPEILMLIHDNLQKLSKGDDIRTIIIRGTGDRAFSSGYDINAIPTKANADLQERLRDRNPLELALESIANFPYPVIAMLNGYAYGAGCELAITCDIRIGAEDIRMGMPPARLGLVYSVSGLMKFARVVGWGHTKEIFFTGRYYDANRAKEMGLVDYLVPREELEAFTMRLAEEISGNAPLSLKGTKRILNLIASQKLSDSDSKEANRQIAIAFNSDDLKEGQIAFFQKRKAEFKGK